jgi:hypothetical protein
VVVLGAIGAGLQSNRSRAAQFRPNVSDVATIFVASFAVNGNGIDPSSGAALANEVRRALGADSSVAIRRSVPTAVNPARPPIPDDDGARGIAAAQRAGADYVLLGTVRRKERDAEIALRLIRVADASTAWTGTFWRSPTDFASFAIDLAAAVTEAIRAERDRQARKSEPQSTPAERTRH